MPPPSMALKPIPRGPCSCPSGIQPVPMSAEAGKVLSVFEKAAGTDENAVPRARALSVPTPGVESAQATAVSAMVLVSRPDSMRFIALLRVVVQLPDRQTVSASSS